MDLCCSGSRFGKDAMMDHGYIDPKEVREIVGLTPLGKGFVQSGVDRERKRVRDWLLENRERLKGLDLKTNERGDAFWNDGYLTCLDDLEAALKA